MNPDQKGGHPTTAPIKHLAALRSRIIGRYTSGRAVGHLIFGAVAHRCPGAPLARIEAEIALRRLFETFPGLALVDRAVSRVPSQGMMGHQELPVVLRPA
ncbi:hypothetical protein ACFY8S_13715 [Streptomyces hygroscopicus]|uniref:hypothetical protein n=1 Tax=Streptomyces hygroscopicus TaxID=1912 RepID=UPI0036A580C0